MTNSSAVAGRLALAAAILVLALGSAPAPAVAHGGEASRPALSTENATNPEDEEGGVPVAGLLALGGVALVALVGAVIWSVRRRPPAP